MAQRTIATGAVAAMPSGNGTASGYDYSRPIRGRKAREGAVGGPEQRCFPSASMPGTREGGSGSLSAAMTAPT